MDRSIIRERIREEKIAGVVYDMSPAPHYIHSLIGGNLYAILRAGLKNSLCRVFNENIDYMYDPQTDDYVEPDIIVCCNIHDLEGNFYRGTPKFIAEIISPSTVKRDKGIKKDIYERAGVSEYWIISPMERGVDIYYLKDGKYVLEESYVLDAAEESAAYNAKQEITLRCFPIHMTLEEIFEL